MKVSGGHHSGSGKIILIETERLFLKSPSEGMIDKVVLYLSENRSFFTPWLPKIQADFYTFEKQATSLKRDLQLLQEGSQVRLYIFLKEKPENIIGDLCFSNILGGTFQSCFVGYKLSEKENNKGYMTEALLAAVDFAFTTLHLHRIEANIIPGNKASVRVAEKTGFVLEGYSKSYLKINDVWEDHLRYAIVNTRNEDEYE